MPGTTRTENGKLLTNRGSGGEYEYYDEEDEEQKNDYDFRDFMDDKPLTTNQNHELVKIEQSSEITINNTTDINAISQVSNR